MSTFLNRFCWDADTRLIVVSTLSADPVYHDGLVYDVVENSLLVDYGGTAAFYQAGIGFTTTGAMCVFDASGGLPADTRWQSGLPISEAEHRLCVDPTGAVAYYHQGVTFTVVGAVAVNGDAPPSGATFDTVRIGALAPEATPYVAQIYYGSSGSIAGYYTSQATFLSDHPGLTLQPLTGIAPAGGRVTPVSISNIAAVSDSGPAYVVDSADPNGGGVYCSISPLAGGAILTLTFSPPVNSVGFFVSGGAAGNEDIGVEFLNGVTSLFFASINPTNISTYTTFAGYSVAAAATFFRITDDDSIRITGDGDSRVFGN